MLKPRLLRPRSVTLLAVGTLGLVALTVRPAVHAVQTPPTTRTPVIVELFTSEGCSDCPPADVLLGELKRPQSVAGAEVIALEEHVDYFNHGGWEDRFSSRAFSDRQIWYSEAFGRDTVYTPEMIVDGRTEFVGSDEARARAAIAGAARQPKARVSVVRSGDTLSVLVDRLPTSAAGGPIDVMLAVTEDGLSTSVGDGENAGRRLTHSAVVRRLMPLGTVSGGAFTATPSLKTYSGRRGDFNAVVFVQDRESRRIIGAAQVALA